MIDIKLIRENSDLVKENIKKKFQDEKLPLVDEVKELDEKVRTVKLEGDNLRSERNKKSADIGLMFREGKKSDAEALKEEVKDINEKLVSLEEEEDK